MPKVEDRFNISGGGLIITWAGSAPGGEVIHNGPFLEVPDMTWANANLQAVQIMERRLLDLQESMWALGIEVANAQGDPDKLRSVAERHLQPLHFIPEPPSLADEEMAGMDADGLDVPAISKGKEGRDKPMDRPPDLAKGDLPAALRAPEAAPSGGKWPAKGNTAEKPKT